MGQCYQHASADDSPPSVMSFSRAVMMVSRLRGDVLVHLDQPGLSAGLGGCDAREDVQLVLAVLGGGTRRS